MMELETNDLGILKEVRKYPALLARLAKLERISGDGVLRGDQLLLDVLSDAIPFGDDRSTFGRLLERGEIAAAEKFFELAELDQSERRRIVRRKAACQQELDQMRRQVMGLLLLLKDVSTPAINGKRDRIQKISNHPELGEFRPGWVIQQLQSGAEFLERAISEEIRRIRARRDQLKGENNESQGRDLSLALQRLDELLQSRENLPAAQELLKLAERAADGNLNREDLRALHSSRSHEERLIRPWCDFEVFGDGQANKLVRRLRSDDIPAGLSQEFDSEGAIRLFKALSLRGRKLDTKRVGQALSEFLSLDCAVDKSLEITRGAAFSIKFATPRVPALGGAYFSGGIRLIIPGRPDPRGFRELLKELPDNIFPIFYYPGTLAKRLVDQFRLEREVPHFDNFDLLRLAECAGGRREHAFQQIILPRSSFSHVNPWQLGGPVAEEMFRGRRKIIDKLKRPKGPTVLFSGRMMGKSSILDRIYRRVEADTDNPHERAIKISNAGVDLFRALVGALAKLVPETDGSEARRRIDGLQLSSSLSPGQLDERKARRIDLIRKLIGQILDQRQARLLILIDEADRFASEDSREKQEYSIAWHLRDLEFDKPNQLRVVFAGFHTIHEQIISENGAFANWYGLQQLTTLEKVDARRLVVEPFADFGFSFTSRAAVQRILEFTGNHPLLIQEVCSRLMERMNARRTGHLSEEVITIEAGDVEVVCRDDQLRDRLYQVLSLNLNEHPRLKLMVYLILDSCGAGTKTSLRLDEFDLESLKAELIKWYGNQFNTYFDEKNIGALIARLKALGLVQSRGGTYQFVNRIFARMLMEDQNFELKLEKLLSLVTNPVKGQQRRFVTLPNEYLERIGYTHHTSEAGEERGRRNILFIGLPGTEKEYIARELFKSQAEELVVGGQGAFLISGQGCSTVSELRERLKEKLKERRKTLSLADFVVKNNLDTLVITNADSLADTGELATIAQSLNERDRRIIAFGESSLARAYVANLFAENFEPIRLERLRSQELQQWGKGRCYELREQVLTFDDNTARRVCEATGGYLPLVVKFAEFAEEKYQTAKDYLARPDDVDRFIDKLAVSKIEDALLGTLNQEERDVLESLYRYADDQSILAFDMDLVDEFLIPVIEEKTGQSKHQVRDAIDILELLDLIQFSTGEGERALVVDPEGPLAMIFG